MEDIFRVLSYTFLGKKIYYIVLLRNKTIEQILFGYDVFLEKNNEVSIAVLLDFFEAE
jgi:hypothetical protein